MLIGCNQNNSLLGSISSSTLPSPQTKTLELYENETSSIELNPDSSKYDNLTVVITNEPQKGTLSLSGTTVTYKSKPFQTGSDSFQYYLVQDQLESEVGTVQITTNAQPSGTYTYLEDYSGQRFTLENWQSFASSFGHISAPSQSFISTTFDSATVDAREIGITTDDTQYGGDTLYSNLFSALPIDGAGGAMKDWPWAADLLNEEKCFYQVTIDFKLVYASSNVLVSLLLNYRIEESESGQKLTGYQALINGGGNSVTLSRFNEANERATSFMDRWPNTNSGTEAFANPVTHGPYRGWDTIRNTWPAGGSVNNSALNSVYMKAKYSYNPSTGDTTINYEVLNDDGTDDTPGTWDFERTLTGEDSLPPGGAFGYMPMPYNISGFTLNSKVYVSNFNLECTIS